MGKNRDFSKFPNAIIVLDNGNVGIGTTTFSEGTQPAGTLSFIPNSSVSSGPLLQLAGNGRIRPASDGDRLSIDGNALYLNSTFNGNVIIATGGGSLGVSTSSPGSKVDIRVSNGDSNQMRISADSTVYKDMQWYDTTSGKMWIWSHRIASGSNNAMALWYNNGSSYNTYAALWVTTNNNIGIGNSIYAYANIRPADNGYGAIDFYNNGFGYAYSAKLFTFKAPDLSEAYGFTNDYGSGTAAELAMVAKQSSIGNLGFYTGTSTTAKMRINVNGQVTLPYQPCFYAYGPTGGYATSGTGAFTSFTQTRINRGSHYNTSNGRFTAPVAGAYEFIFSLLWRQTSDSGAGEISIGVNGSNINGRGIAYTSVPGNSGFHDQTFVRVILNLAAGDYVTGWIHSSGNGGGGNWYYGDGLAHFSGMLLG